MERQAPVDPELALAELDAIAATERKIWLDYAAIKPTELGRRKLALIVLIGMCTGALLTGYFWLQEQLGIAASTVVAALFILLMIKVIGPWIDRRQMGVSRPAVPPAAIRAEVHRLHLMMMLPMFFGIVIGIPAVLAATEAGNFALVAMICIGGMSLLMLATIWWNRRLARKIQAGWRPGGALIPDEMGRVLVVIAAVAFATVAIGLVIGLGR